VTAYRVLATLSLKPPGKDTDAEVLFWADEARIHATVGTPFELWYGRPVGHGTVTALADELGGGF
jgi:hypothetical protein